MKQMRVLSIFRSRLGEIRGTPIRVKSILAELSRANSIDLTVASWDKEAPSGVSKHFYLSNDHWDDFKKLYRYVKENKIDVVIGHTTSTYIFLWPLKLLTTAKIVLEMHGFREEESLLYGNRSLLYYHRKKFLYGLFYRFCDLITTCGYTATEVLSRYNDNVITVAGGVDLDVFRPDTPSGNYFKKRGIVIGYAGNSRVWQGIEFLIEVFRELRVNHPEFRLVILTSENKTYGDGVEVYGPIPHEKVPGFLIDCDIMVIPRGNNEVSRLSLPTKFAEYMALARPVVASDVGDARCMVQHGVSGLLYNTDDKESLKDVLLSLRDSQYRGLLGRNARSAVEQHYTWEKQVSIMIDRLEKLMV